MIERLVLEQSERDFRGVAEVLVPHLFVRIEHVGALDQLAELDDEHPRPLAVREQQTEALVLVEHRLELAHVGRGLDDDLARHSHRAAR